MTQEKYDKIQTALGEGQISEALDMLVAAAKGRDKRIREDILLLKSKFEYNRSQYQVRGVLTDKEFNIHFSKAILGAQDALERLYSGDTTETAAAATKTRAFLWIWPVAVVILLGMGGLWWYFSQPSSLEPKITDQITTELQPVTDQEEKTVSQPLEKKEEKSTDSAPVKKPAQEKRSLTNSPTSTNNQPAEQTEPTVPPPSVQTFQVNIIRNSDMSDAEIFVDGEPAIILSNTLIITTIQVTQKPGMHVFEIKKDGQSCKRERLITQNKQKITFNCT